MIRRIIVLIMDSVGIGEQPDAADYESAGANTLHHAAKAFFEFQVDTLQQLGLGNITGICDVPFTSKPMASFGRMTEVTCGNDTFAGVWEMAGVIFTERFTSFKPKMSNSLVTDMQRHISIKTLCNSYISGFHVLDQFADEHFSSGCPIVYTCDDGVVLVAAHEDILPAEKLRHIANQMSVFFTGKRVVRVIARPFIGEKGNFIRTENRQDCIVPFDKSAYHLFGRMQEVGICFTTTEHLTLLIGEEFVTETIPGIKDTAGIMDSVCELLKGNNRGISMFVAPDFDMSGHRKEPETYARDLMAFDRHLNRVLHLIRDDDILVITADHGCDPTLPVRGHTREYVPLLVVNGRYASGQNLGTRTTFADIGQTICDLIGARSLPTGESFVHQLRGKG